MGVCKISIVMVGPDWHPGRDTCKKLGGIESPLLVCITLVKFFIEIPSDNVDNGVFAGSDRVPGITNGFKIGLQTFFIEVQAIEAVDGVDVDGNGKKLAVNACENSVFVRALFGEGRKIVKNFLRVGVENMGAISMDHDALFIMGVVGISGNMGPFVDDNNLFPGF